MTVDFFPAHPHVWAVAVQIVGLTAAREAQLGVLVEIERERLEHRLALARAAQRLASAQALTAEIEALPAPMEVLR